MTRQLRISVDRNICTSNGQCVRSAPETFRLDAYKIAEALAPLREEQSDIWEAAELCPVAAITLIDDQTGDTLYP